MALWWVTFSNLYASRPWDTWFYAMIIADAWGWPGWNNYEGNQYYWFKKISPSGGHRQQLAIKSDIPHPYVPNVQMAVKANTIYVCCYPGDTPNLGSVGFIDIGPPCGNWWTDMYVEGETTRSQTYSIRGAVQSNRELPAKVSAAIAKNDELTSGITATIQAAPELPIEMRAAIMGNPELEYPIRAAIRAERLLEPAIIASISKDFSLDSGVTATIQGNPLQWYGARAAIKGETEKTVGIKAFVVKSRATQIMLEMENLWPQELDLRSTPNSPSRFNDWRTDQLGE